MGQNNFGEISWNLILLKFIFQNKKTKNEIYNMTKISITRAFSLKKTLVERFNKELANSKLIGVAVGKKMSDTYVSYAPEDFEKQAVESFQSITDIAKILVEIRTKIDQSNFVTKVKIGGVEMTVLEAIRKKDEIAKKAALVVNLRGQLRVQRSLFERAIANNNSRVERIVSEQTASGVKDKNLEETVRENIDALYAVSFVDPLKLEEKIKELEKEVEDFTSEVDFALSESNSTTYIEID